MSTTVSVTGGLLYIRQNASVVEYSTNGTAWSTINFPMTIVNNNTSAGVVQVLFTTDITMTSSLGYFICGSNKIQFGSRTLRSDGSRPVITIDYVGNNYPGLIQNGITGVNGNADISVVNLRVTTTGAVGLSSGGWVVQDFFGRGALRNFIINCSSDGPIATNCGGIGGSYVGNSGGNVTITGCTSSGTMGNTAGGIVASYVGSSTGNVTISDCSSSGSIGTFSGGICGTYAGYGGTLTITKCFSTGSIGGGGICASYCAYGGTVNVTYCYSTGNIATNSGGIIADNAALSSGTLVINKCYATGFIASLAAGILGPNTGLSIFLTACYTSGAMGALNGGIRYGTSTDGATNYSEGNNGSSGWKDTNASTTLGSTGWISLATNTPYELTPFRYTPYTTTNIQSNYLLQTSATETVQAGNTTTTVGLASGFSIVNTTAGITINSSTGLLTTSTNTTPGTYTLTIRTTSGYSVSTFTLVVTAIPPPAPAPAPSGRTSSQSRFNENQQYITLVGGSPLLVERTANVNSKFASYADYLRYRKAASQPR